MECKAWAGYATAEGWVKDAASLEPTKWTTAGGQLVVRPTDGGKEATYAAKSLLAEAKYTGAENYPGDAKCYPAVVTLDSCTYTNNSTCGVWKTTFLEYSRVNRLDYDCATLTAKSKIDGTVITTDQIKALSLGAPWSESNACLAPYVAPQHADNGTANADGLYNAKTVTPTAGFPINAVAKVKDAAGADTTVTTKYGDLHFQTSWRMDNAGADANLVYGIWMRLVTDQTNWATVAAPWLTVFLETSGTLAAGAVDKAAVTGINLSCAKNTCIDGTVGSCKFSCMDVNSTLQQSIKEMRDAKAADLTKNVFLIDSSWSTFDPTGANTASRILYNFLPPNADDIMKYTSGAQAATQKFQIQPTGSFLKTNVAKDKVTEITEFREAQVLALIDLKQGGKVNAAWNFRADNNSVRVGDDPALVFDAGDADRAKEVEVMGDDFVFEWSAKKVTEEPKVTIKTKADCDTAKGTWDETTKVCTTAGAITDVKKDSAYTMTAGAAVFAAVAALSF